MSYGILTAPIAPHIQWRQTASTPIASIILNDVKTFINRPVEDTFWDNETTAFIQVAQRAIEQHCEMSLSLATWVGTLPRLFDEFRIVRRPFAAVEKIEYVEPATGNILTVDPSIYHVVPIAQNCAMVALGEDASWPDTANRLDAVRITVKTGFYDFDGVTPKLPQEIVQALSMTVTELDAARGDDGSPGRQTVYAMKQVKAGYLSASTQALIGHLTYRAFVAV
jgi:hypothetical protein